MKAVPLLLALTSCGLGEKNTDKNAERWVTVEAGEFGDWLEEKNAKKDYFACGMQLR